MLNYSGLYPALAKKLQQHLSKLDILPTSGGNRHPISAAIMMDGKLIAATSAGFDGRDGSPATIDGLYNVGSVSKVYCAVAILKLVEMGAISLDDYVYEILPDFYTRDERYKKITVRMTLDHSSGLPGTNFYNFYGPEWKFDNNIDGMYEYWHNAKLKAEPGEYSVYCNEGFELAAAIIECRSGMSYYQFLKKYIFDPVGIISTGVADKQMDTGKLMTMPGKDTEYVSVLGTGGIRSNLIDCAKFGDLFLNSKGIIDPELLNITKQHWGKTFLKNDTLTSEYGLGWDSVSYKGNVVDLGEGVLTKNGSSRQFGSQLIIVPKYNISAAISCLFGYEKSPGDILDELILIVLKELGIADVKRPETPAPVGVEVPAELIKKYEGVYYSGLGILKAEFRGSELYILFYTGRDRWVENPLFPKATYNGEAFVNERGGTCFEEARGGTYLLLTMSHGMRPVAQRLSKYPEITQGWKNRIGKKYITCNLPVSEFFIGTSAGVEICDLFGDGVISLASSSLVDGPISYYTAVCSTNDDTDMYLDAPGMGSRDAWAFFVKKDDNGAEVLTRLNFRYVESTYLSPIRSGEISIKPGYNNAVYSTTAGTKIRYTLPENTRVIFLNENLEVVYSNAFPMEKLELIVDGYVLFCNDDGCTFDLEVLI